jgi:hypothetical protein
MSDLTVMIKKIGTMIFIGAKEADHVMIEPLKKVESGWRTANIGVRCGVWAGHYAGQFMVGELTKFGKEIEYLHEGLRPKAELKAAEHYLEMSLASDGHGGIHARGRAQDRLGSKNMLEFEFEVDPATLADVAQALVEADRAE